MFIWLYNKGPYVYALSSKGVLFVIRTFVIPIVTHDTLIEKV